MKRLSLEGLPVHSLRYERDLLDPATRQAALDRAFEFLGVAPVPASTPLVRSVGAKLEDTVRNLDELSGALRHTRFERFLEDLSCVAVD